MTATGSRDAVSSPLKDSSAGHSLGGGQVKLRQTIFTRGGWGWHNSDVCHVKLIEKKKNCRVDVPNSDMRFKLFLQEYLYPTAYTFIVTHCDEHFLYNFLKSNYRPNA